MVPCVPLVARTWRLCYGTSMMASTSTPWTTMTSSHRCASHLTDIGCVLPLGRLLRSGYVFCLFIVLVNILHHYHRLCSSFQHFSFFRVLRVFSHMDNTLCNPHVNCCSDLGCSLSILFVQSHTYNTVNVNRTEVAFYLFCWKFILIEFFYRMSFQILKIKSEISNNS